MKESLKLKKAEKLTNNNPTQEQIDNGTYQKGLADLKGFKIAIENPVGSTRSGVDDRGNPWKTKMEHTYGYFLNTEGNDGDPVDVFIGSEINNNFDVYVIDQVKEGTKEFDEHKVMFGFNSKGEAVKAYLDNYQDNWTGFSNITAYSLSSFKEWLYDEELVKQPAKRQPMTSIENYTNGVSGDIPINIIKLVGEVLAEETLLDLQRQARGIQAGHTLVVEIASPGGSVSEGLLIMKWLNELSESGVQIVTVVTANAYSIASLIMLAADIRLISKHGKVMVHNPMVPELSYVNANELEKHISSLRELEGFMYDLYKLFTGLEEDQIRLLMDNETYLTPADAVQNGFADMVVSIKKTPYEMASKQEKTVNMSKTVNVLKQVIAKINGADFVNQLYYDNEGGEIEIYQADPAQYQIGDKASINEGEVQLADGSKLIVKGGVIEDIIRGEVAPAEVPAVEATDEIVPAPAVEIVDQDGSTGELEVPAVIEDVVDPLSVPAPVSGEFNEGSAPVAPLKEKDAMPASVVEKTESTVTTKETMAQAESPVAPVEEPVAQVEEVVEAIASPGATPVVVEEEMVSIPAEAFKNLLNKVEEMEARMKSQDEEMKAQEESGKDFQATAAEAIEVLAKNTVSGFVPEARVTANSHALKIGKNSIFANLKRKAGLAK